MDSPARPNEALTQPTRARLFTLLAELRRPVGTEELAEHLDLHPNGVRIHLERLHEAGLVTRERIRQARGRPRDTWLISPDASPTEEPPVGYEQLGRWLARLITPGKSSLRKIESTGREIGRELAPEGAGTAEAKMHATLTSMGFQPHREACQSGAFAYRLCNCPYREAVQENAEVICTLHRGITRGLLDELAPTSRLSDFVAGDPFLGDCLVELRGDIADEGLQRLPDRVAS
jgi:predicted ArsR family transcriptional regulator